MVNQALFKRIQDYMNDKKSPEYAILLHGKWGCGKTFFCKKFMEKEKYTSDDIWYISAFGIKEKKDLDEKIFEAAHTILSSKAGKVVTSLGYSIIRTACKYYGGIDTNDIANSLGGLLKKDGSKIQCRLLIVDDLERAEMPIGEIFGYFSSWISDGIRMVFVSNEDEISEKQLVDYNRFKEKIIGESYEILPDYGNVIKMFWESVGFPSDEDYTKFLSEVCNIVGYNNLRAVRQIVHQWHILYDGLEPIYRGNEFLIDFFKTYVVLKLQHKIKPNAYDYNGTDKDPFEKRRYFREKCHEAWMAFKLHNMSLVTYEEKLSSKNDDLLKSRTIDLIICPLLLPDAWFGILNSGKEYNAGWINEQIRILYEKKQKEVKLNKNFNTSLEKMQKIVFSTDEAQVDNIRGMFEKLCEDFQEGRYGTFGQCMRFIQLYMKLFNDEVLPDNIYSTEHLNELLYEYMNRYGAIIRFDGESAPPSGKFLQISDAKIQESIYKLYQLSKNNLRKDMDEVFRNREKFLSFIHNPENAFGKYLDVPILKQVDINSLFEWLENNNDNKVHDELLRFLQYRYGFGINNLGLSKVGYDDYEAVEELKNKYVKRYEATKHKYLLIVRRYKYFIMKYTELMSYMSEEYQKIKSVNG